MIYNIDNPYDLAKFEDYVAKIRDRGGWCELKAIHPSRSVSQNAYLHVLLGFFSVEFGYSMDEVKVDIFKRICNSDIFTISTTNKRGQQVAYLRSTASLTSAEMTTAITRFRNYSASECGLYLPEPSESGLLMYAKQQMELNQEHL